MEHPGSTTSPTVAVEERTGTETEQPWLWNVVLLNDDHHSYEYVIKLVQKLFGHPVEKAFELAKTVDTQGRAICMTTHRELGELKVEQVHGFGPDVLIAECSGSMSAILEPAYQDANNNDDDR